MPSEKVAVDLNERLAKGTSSAAEFPRYVNVALPVEVELPPMEVAEPELPKLDVSEFDEGKARQVFGGRPTSLVVTRETQDLLMLRMQSEYFCRERQLRASRAEVERLKEENDHLSSGPKISSTFLEEVHKELSEMSDDEYKAYREYGGSCRCQWCWETRYVLTLRSEVASLRERVQELEGRK